MNKKDSAGSEVYHLRPRAKECINILKQWHIEEPFSALKLHKEVVGTGENNPTAIQSNINLA